MAGRPPLPTSVQPPSSMPDEVVGTMMAESRRGRAGSAAAAWAPTLAAALDAPSDEGASTASRKEVGREGGRTAGETEADGVSAMGGGGCRRLGGGEEVRDVFTRDVEEEVLSVNARTITSATGC